MLDDSYRFDAFVTPVMLITDKAQNSFSFEGRWGREGRIAQL